MWREKNIVPTSLGSRLALLNMLCFLMIVGLARLFEFRSIVIEALLLILSLPIAIPLMMPQLDHFPSYGEVIMVPIVIVLNAYVWGYGIAYLWRACTNQAEDAEE